MRDRTHGEVAAGLDSGAAAAAARRTAGAPSATRQAVPCPPLPPPGERDKPPPHSSVFCRIAPAAATMTEAQALEKKPLLQQRGTSGSGNSGNSGTTSSVPPEPPREDGVDHTYKESEGPKPPRVVVWRNVLLMTVLHLAAAYGFLLVPSASPLTLLWSALCFVVSALGVTAGAHRLWSHRSYKASTPLKIFLSLANSMAFQNDIYEWARDHRVHHKYSETDADPHNAVRGFFFSHIGWLMLRKHPDVIEKGRKLELTDLQADKVVMFQRHYYKLSVVLMCFFIPMFVPWYLWGESLWVAYFVPALLRYTLVLNSTWLVNSAAHMWGNRPYDTGINPRENKFVTFSAIGEGYHNYHHTFPYDYATSEFGCKLNLTTCFIDLMCFFGLAKDRKRVSSELILARMQRTGDGSHRSG